jgi:hypothetical protein
MWTPIALTRCLKVFGWSKPTCTGKPRSTAPQRHRCGSHRSGDCERPISHSSLPAAASGHYLVEAVSVGGGKSPSMMKPSNVQGSHPVAVSTATKPS